MTTAYNILHDSPPNKQGCDRFYHNAMQNITRRSSISSKRWDRLYPRQFVRTEDENKGGISKCFRRNVGEVRSVVHDTIPNTVAWLKFNAPDEMNFIPHQTAISWRIIRSEFFHCALDVVKRKFVETFIAVGRAKQLANGRWRGQWKDPVIPQVFVGSIAFHHAH